MENINRYLEATGNHLGVEGWRYGSGYFAIILHRSSVDFLFNKLEGDDFAAAEAYAFLSECTLIPFSCGSSPQQALKRLNAKLGALYKFESKDAGNEGWKELPNFHLVAEHDIDPGEEQTFYEVEWDSVIQDISGRGTYFYSDAKRKCSARINRDLHALINFKWPEELNKALTLASALS